MLSLPPLGTDRFNGFVRTQGGNLNFRNGPTISSSVIGVIPNGSQVQIVGESNGFYFIVFNGRTGWVSRNFVEVTPRSGVVTTAGGNLNLRSGPSTASPIIASIANGSALTATDITGNFYHVNWNGQVGFASRDFIRLLISPPLPTRMIALTFDDGPRQETDRLLNILERNNVKATFFVLGYLVEPGRNTVARAANLGNEIAGHTWTHDNITELSNEEVIETIQKTSLAIESVTGYSPPIYRPPFGITSPEVQRISGELGYSIVNWTLDTLDWHYRDPNIIYNIIMNNVKDGDIILLHDIHATTVDAMELVIPSLIAEGYQLVTVSELLTHQYGVLVPGAIYGRPRSLTPPLIEDLKTKKRDYLAWLDPFMFERVY